MTAPPRNTDMIPSPQEGHSPLNGNTAPTRRLRMRTLLLCVNLVILVLPLGGIGILRLYENELIRQTETELIAQGAIIVATYHQSCLNRIAEESSKTNTLPAVVLEKSSSLAMPPFSTALMRDSALNPLLPQLDLTNEAIRPRPIETQDVLSPAHPIAQAAGLDLMPILKEGQRGTLAAIRVTDLNGTVVASTRESLGHSIGHLEEVSRALRGEHVSLLRVRISDDVAPPLTSLSRGTRVRVFVAMPVHEQGRILGAVLLSRSPVPVDKALYENRWVLLSAAGGLIVIVLGMTLVVSLTITRPIDALIRQSERVVQGGPGALSPLDHPVTHEVAHLSLAIAEMARVLERRADYMRNFARHVSHEFKTPLTSMKGAIELLRDHLDEMSEQERNTFLHNLELDNRRLELLVQRLMALAMAELQPGAALGEGLNAGEVLLRMCQTFEAEGMKVTCRVPSTPVLVRLSLEVLESALTHLLENCRRHAPGAEVTVMLEKGRTEATLSVEDTGPGISEGNLDRVFDPFFTTARASGGTGMGLPIVRALLEAQGGRIALQPRPPSQRGTCFVLSLPLASKEFVRTA